MSDKRLWPDCGEIRPWRFGKLNAADLDGIPGDEIVAVATDLYEYPTRISIIKPQTRKIVTTYWHMGEIAAVTVLPDFFGPGAPAIVAWGLNNKLDGFDDGLREDPLHRASWNIVPVVMILDPRDMEGLGPPRTERVPWAMPAKPHAYAFLNMPHAPDALQVSFDPVTDTRQVQALLKETPRDQFGSISEVRLSLSRHAQRARPRLEIDICGPGPQGRGLPRVTLYVSDALALEDVLVNTTGGETAGVTKEYWQQYWHPIVQNGQYVDGRELREQQATTE
jgi:hypothetical protein